MEIKKGKIPSAKKVVIYGPEGVGKSTFASQFPDPLFSDTEGSTKELDVSRFPEPSSWTMLMQEAKYVYDHPDCCKTYVVDTADWAEMMGIKHICDKAQKSGIEDFGYGKGYTYAKEEFGRLLNLLSDIVTQRGIHVVITAHATMRKFEQPDEMGAYDRWELKLSKQTAPLLKEWADLLLFANYKTYVVAKDDNGKVYKAQGGRRVMYTSHHPCWDAKNRYGLPEEVPFEYDQIRPVIETGSAHTKRTVPEPNVPIQPSVQTETRAITPEAAADPLPWEEPKQAAYKQDTLSFDNPKAKETEVKFDNVPKAKKPEKTVPDPGQENDIEAALKALHEIMDIYFVKDEDIQWACAKRGYYPIDTPLINYEPGFVWGVLIGAWDKVYQEIQTKDDAGAGANPFLK